MTYTKKGITIEFFENKEDGITFAKETLYSTLTPQSLLLLSGGNTPKSLYRQLSQEGKLMCGSVGLVDERYGNPFHEMSNERLVEESGMIDYLNSRSIPFYSILEKKEQQRTAEDYEKVLAFLLGAYSHRIAIMGIGSDGHISGISPNRVDFKNPVFSSTRLVEFFNTKDTYANGWGERITTTFKALEQITQLIVIFFGQEKKEAIEKMFEEGSEEEIPARFYTRPEIAEKTLFITDIKI